MDVVHHYPPEVTQLLIETVPRLFRGKADVIGFLRGAGVPAADLQDVWAIVRNDGSSITKFEIVRRVLRLVNDRGDDGIRARREIIKRVCEFEDFSACWPEDALKAKGLVAELRRVVDVKDSFIRMRKERDHERAQRAAEYERSAGARAAKQAALRELRAELFALFSIKDPWKRGKALEAVLNKLFAAAGILVRDAFTVRGNAGEGIVEQIDGVILLGGHLVVVEMKWESEPLGVKEVGFHFSRLMLRDPGTRGLVISASGFADTVAPLCREHLSHRAVGLCKLEDLVMLLDREKSLDDYLRNGFDRFIADRIPLFPPA